MTKCFEWIKRNKKSIAFYVVIAVFGIPFVIHFCFKITAPFSWLVAKWEAGNVLEYYGAIISAISATFLGSIALYQNKRIEELTKEANIINDRMTHLEEVKMRTYVRLMKNSCEIDEDLCIYKLKFKIVGEYPISELDVMGESERIFQNNFKENAENKNGVFISKYSGFTGWNGIYGDEDSFEINLYVDKYETKFRILSFKLTLTNLAGFTTNQKFNVITCDRLINGWKTIMS